MKKHLITGYAKILLLSVLMLLGTYITMGCGKKTGPVEESPALAYVPAFSELEIRLGENGGGTEWSGNIFVGKFIKDNRLYAISRSYSVEKGMQDYLTELELDTGEQREQVLGTAARYFEAAEGFIGFRENCLCLYDGNFLLLKEIDLRGLYAALGVKGSQFSCDDIAVDGEGRIGIISGETLVFVDEEGNLLQSIEQPAQMAILDRLAVTRSGEWYVLGANGGSELVICKADLSRGVLDEPLSNVPDGAYYNVCAVEQAGEEGLYIGTNNSIFRYDIKTAACEEVFGLRDYGITLDENTAFGVNEEGGFCIANETGSHIGEDGTKQAAVLELAVVTGVPEGEVKPRTELVIAAFYEPALKYREPVMEFNRNNPDYYVTIKMYYDSGHYDTAKQAFYNDLLTGNGADIFWVQDYEIDLENLGQKGAVADLYELMDADPELGREDFISNILAAMEYDGKLYGISPAFSLYTLVGKASLLDGYERWDIDALYDLMERYPGACPISPVTRENGLEALVGYSMDLFYDAGTGECFFDSPEFERLLEIAGALPTEYDFGTPMQELIQGDQVLLYSGIVADCTSVKWIDLYFGEEEEEYIGYPGTESAAVIRFDYFMAISARSENEQGSWEFIKSYFTEDYQKNSYYLPVMEKYFDELLEEELEECGYSSAMDMYGTSVKGEPLTGEQARTLRELADSAVKTARYDKEIYNIILEEAQSYFAGQKSAGEAAAVIQDRAEIYLGEKR